MQEHWYRSRSVLAKIDKCARSQRLQLPFFGMDFIGIPTRRFCLFGCVQPAEYRVNDSYCLASLVQWQADIVLPIFRSMSASLIGLLICTDGGVGLRRE